MLVINLHATPDKMLNQRKLKKINACYAKNNLLIKHFWLSIIC